MNTNIPLMAEQPQIGQGILQLANMRRQSTQRIDAEKDYRQDRAKQNELMDLKIKGAKGDLNEQQLKGVSMAAASIQPMLESGDTKGALTFLKGRVATLEADGRDPSDTMEMIQAIESGDLKGAMSANKAMIDFGVNAGWLKAPEIDKGTVLSEGQQLIQNGQVVAENKKPQIPQTAMGKAALDFRNGDISEKQYKTIVQQESGLKSQEQIDQLIQIERGKAIASRDDEVRRRELEKLDLGIAAEQAKLKKGEKDASKAEGLKAEALRLVNELRANRDGVTSYVGPIDSMVDTTFGEKTTKARTNINQLLSILTAENLGLMSGVLSETDVKIIQQIAGGGLDVMGDEDNFMAELDRLGGSLGATSGATQELPAGVRSIKKVSD